MNDINKQVFLSYRRELSKYEARSVYQDLRNQGFDVFMDVESIDNGEFSPVILHQIEARPHFLIILTPGALERTKNQGDWLRREIEFALEKKRNIVPVLMNNFDFDAEEKKHSTYKLPGKVGKLKDYNFLKVPDDYFEEAMKKLATRFLKKRINIFLSETPKNELADVRNMIKKADRAKIDLDANKWIFPIATNFKPFNKKPLTAPKLQISQHAFWNISLSWSKIENASGYVLEECFSKDFKNAVIVYDGDRTTFSNLPMESTLSKSALTASASLFSFGLNKYFRVKAKGGLSYTDSPWSNTVEIKPVRKTLLSTPKLEINPLGILGSTNFKWSEIQYASGYILEESLTEDFKNSTVLYDGDKTMFSKILPISFFSKYDNFKSGNMHSSLYPNKYYRVKAKGGLFYNDSLWSNTVEIN